jgi:hypothetical protein
MANNQSVIIGGFLAAGVLVYAAVSDSTIWEVLTGGSKPIDDSGNITQSDGDDNIADAPYSANVDGVGSASADTPLRSAVVEAAQIGLSIKSGYAEVRPYPSSLEQAGTDPTDCSGFATLCYKTAGAPDPNGMGYNGYGYTGTLMEHGQKTNSPSGGDLHFWSNPGHVAVDIGNGAIIQWGSAPGPSQSTVDEESKNHAAYLGARSYLPKTSKQYVPLTGPGRR